MAEEDVAAKDDDAEPGGGIKALIKKITSSKKMMIIVGSAILLFLLIVGGAAYYFLSGDETQEEVVKEGTAESDDETAEGVDGAGEEEVAKAKFESVHIFHLETFFLPIRLKNNKESGRFLLVTPNFRMSNSHLNGEINKKLPLIREKMYTIFRREKLKDLTEKNTVVQERIKKDIQDRTNELLPVGSGVVKDVFFSQFIIK
jgi:flagellar basal body-associated protein FliL